MSTPTKQGAGVHVAHDGQQITMYTTSWCPDCRRAKRVFAALNVPFTEVDIEADDSAAELVIQLNNGARSVPTIVFPDGSQLVEPSNMALEKKLAQYVVPVS